MAKNGVVGMDQKGWQVTLRLTDGYMAIAKAPMTFERVVNVTPVEDPRMGALLRIAAGAGALGGRVNVTIEGCVIEDGNGRN